MKKATKFGDLYKDSRWQQKRLEIMERDKWTCQSCGKSGEGVTLNVHHAYYESGKKPWEHEEYSLITWCKECHKKRHNLNQMLAVWIADLEENEYYGLYYTVCMLRFKKFFRVMKRYYDKRFSVSDQAVTSCLIGLFRQHKKSEGEA